MSLPASFPLPLRLERTGPRNAISLAEFVFLSPSLGRIEIESGFDTDYASVPRIFWSIYPPDGDYTPAAFVHDALYFYGTAGVGRPVITRAQADAALLEGMVALGIPWLTRRVIYRAVRLGGWVAWNRNAKWHAAEAAADADPFPIE